MPIKHRIRTTNKRQHIKQRGLVKGKKPHRQRNAHSVMRTLPYVKAIFLWALCFCVLLCALGILGYGIYLKNTKYMAIGLIVVVFWLALRFGYYLACKGTTCPLCRAYHLVDGRSSKHQKAYKVFPLSYSTTAIFTAALRLCVRCMHCGVTFDITKRNR